MKKLEAFTFLMLASLLGFGQSDSTITAIAQKHGYSFSYNTSFSGEGWNKVLEAAANNKYLLIGEDHGLAEVPVFTIALIDEISYDLFVTEIDSTTASIAQRISQGATSSISKFHQVNPSALSFYSAKEEFEVLTRLSASEAEIWGLDQVSLFSTGLVLRRLAELAKSEKAKKIATEMADLSDARFRESISSGNLDTLFIFSSKKSVFENLREAFVNESSEANSLLNDIEASWKIYNQIDGANHATRIGSMKAKLLNYYLDQKIKGNPVSRVLYKFGAYHVSKAESYLGGFDVGNLVSNLAHAEGESSYHLMIVGKKGQMNTFITTEGMKSVSYNIETDKTPLSSLKPFASQVADSWVFFDLKTMRKELKKEKINIDNRFLKATINGYDGLVIIPESTASKMY